MKDTKSRVRFEVGSPLFYAVVGTGSGVVAMILCCLVGVGAVLIYKHNKVKGEHVIYNMHVVPMNHGERSSVLYSHTVSAITNTGLERRCSVASRQTDPANEKGIHTVPYSYTLLPAA